VGDAHTLPPKRAEVVVCGAGIAGIAAAYWLAVRCGVGDVVLVDERPPLSLTSDKSTEAYRNWWPGPDDAMVRVMNRSIDLLEELARASDNVFLLNRRGYVYATAEPARWRELEAAAQVGSSMGAGPVRSHTRDTGAYQPVAADGWEGGPTGADLIVDRALLREHFPYLTDRVVGVLHVRRCGWFSGQQLGMYLLERARERGVRLIPARLEAVESAAGRVCSASVRAGETLHAIETSCFVNAAGPYLRSVAAKLGVELPVFSERHLKACFADTRGVVPRHAPLLIWEDAQELAWSEEERALLAESSDNSWLLAPFPAAVHMRPEGGSDNILLLWPYDAAPVQEDFPLPEEPAFPEVVMRGMSTMVPGLRGYVDALPKSFVDGGYYTKTRENRFLSCPLPVEGSFVLGALSGYGLMVACGAAEILAAHVTGGALPDYAAAFALERYEDSAYCDRMRAWGSTGQL
jgi:glycine/D-amino acid oxidase-like deaminating enzyme